MFVFRSAVVITTVAISSFAGAFGSAPTEKFFFDSGSWSKYLTDPPEILLVDLPPEMDRILSQGEKILVNLFDAERLDPEAMVVEKFEPRLESLKRATPDLVTAEGYSTRVRWHPHAYTSSTTASTGSGHHGYYSYRDEQKQRSTSPSLIREVRFAVRNIDLDSIEPKIDMLDMSHRKWMQRTSDMPGSGTSSLIRDANFEYLDRLKEYIAEWNNLQNDIKKYRRSIAESQMDRTDTLTQWKDFEANELEALHHFFENDSVERIQSDDGKFYMFPAESIDKDAVLACVVSGRRLYFRLNPEESVLHPFGLISMGSGDEEAEEQP